MEQSRTAGRGYHHVLPDILWHRRALMQAMAAFAVAAPLSFDAHARSLADPFALGVASGDPDRDGFVLWTRLVGVDAARLAGHAVAIRYEIASDEGFRNIVKAGQGLARPERAHAVHVEVTGLSPGRPYWYRFHALGATSPVGRAVTVPRQADRLRLALTSCQHWEQARFGAYRDIVAAQPDLILQVGDYIYEQSYAGQAKVRDFGVPEPRDLASYRLRHALYKTDPDLQAAHRAAPWIVTWDDHEVLNDYANLANREGLPPEQFAPRRAAAYQAYFEHMPIRPSLWLGRRAPRLYRAVDWAELASLSILDTRQYRSTPPCAPANVARNGELTNCAEASAPNRTIMGTAQESWLAGRLTREQRPWTIIAQQVFFAPLWLDGGHRSSFSDQWDGYAANRDRLLGGLAQPAVRNAVVLSGDVHSFWCNDLNDGSGKAVGTEIVTSAIAAASPPPGRFGDVKAHNPHIRFSDTRHAGYVLIDISRHALDADFRAIADLTRVDSPPSSLAQFRIEAGSRISRKL
ncbi:alkaline phosphatase D family protein [Sphingobium sp. CR2-8]|uniref:alkaline phosphatase D family protein n=1 Tax=Sphingobium sp. CR2-8 TaxID=1306534 RepID=UPI002DBEA3E4|nr:alkaline phosphatase D family protein [Sphingobium sp. CR2-8]MEC3909348.1 alkaline phosphatase D family protein [Sphingobium sp. CR2-8]